MKVEMEVIDIIRLMKRIHQTAEGISFLDAKSFDKGRDAIVSELLSVSQGLFDKLNDDVFCGKLFFSDCDVLATLAENDE